MDLEENNLTSQKSVVLTIIKVIEVPGQNWLLPSLSIHVYQFHIAREAIRLEFFWNFKITL